MWGTRKPLMDVFNRVNFCVQAQLWGGCFIFAKTKKANLKNMQLKTQNTKNHEFWEGLKKTKFSMYKIGKKIVIF